MQMGLLAYIRRLFGGGDAEIRLMRLPQKLLTPPQIIRRSSPQSFCAALPGNSPPQRKEKTNRGEKNPKLTTSFQPFPPTCIQNQRPCPPGRLISTRVQKNLFAPPIPFPNITKLHGFIYKSSPHHLEAITISCLRATLAKSDFLSFLFFFCFVDPELLVFYTGAGFC